MSSYSLHDIATSSDRHKIYTVMCSAEELPHRIATLQSENIPILNIGKELASFIKDREDKKYLSIDAYEFIKALFDKNRSKLNGGGNDLVAIHNLGILFEPALELNAVQLLKEFSKSAAIIII